MQVHITQSGNVSFTIQARTHTLVSDQPAENGGEDSGMTPPELLLASLGSCAAYYALQYLKTRGLADSGVEVSVTAETLKSPARLGDFRVAVICPVTLTPDQEQGMLRSVHQCLVHNTLLSAPKVAINLSLLQTESRG
jgi:putative redox protein